MIWRTLLFVAGLLLAQPALAQTDDLAEALAMPVAGGLTGARDTARFAWVENAAGVRNVWIADAGKPARQVTAYAGDDGLLVYDVTLSRDGTKLAYVRGGDDEFPDGSIPNAGSAAAAPKQQVFLAALDGGAPTLVGEGHLPVFDPMGGRLAFTRKGEIWLWEGAAARKLASVPGEATRLQWSPDGARLTFVANHDDYSFVAVLDVADARVRFLEPGLGFSVEPVFSPDGSRIAFIQYADPPAGAAPDAGSFWSLRVADAATGKARTVWTAPAGLGGRYFGTRSRNLFWSESGDLVFPWERSGWVHPYAIDAAKGGEPRELTPGAFEVEGFVLAPGGKSITYAANPGDLDARRLWSVPLEGGAPRREIPSSDAIQSFPTYAGGALGLIASDEARPAYPATVEHRMTPLHNPPVLKGAVKPESVTFKAEDGVEVHAQLFRAAGKGRHPALIFVHGGPRRQMLPGFHPMGYYSNAYILNQHFAGRGYDVLSVNYRSGTGYGRAFREAPGIAREGATEYRDVIAAGRWLAAWPHVDAGRIGIWGGSWGGYLTALALARDSDLFAAGVDFHGVHTMLRGLPGNLSPDAQAAARQLQWSSSPMGSIGTWRSPVLLIHGDDDRNVDFDQSLLLARELRARSIPFEELVFPGERHEFFRYADWLASYRAAEAFLDKHVMRR
ncbi:MAG: prolyl oligopeptidase family serine peptidase [Pseudomonadota bacterium]